MLFQYSKCEKYVKFDIFHGLQRQLCRADEATCLGLTALSHKAILIGQVAYLIPRFPKNRSKSTWVLPYH